MEPTICRWRGCTTPAAFTMARATGPVIAHYCPSHIDPAVADWRFDGPPVAINVFRLGWASDPLAPCPNHSETEGQVCPCCGF